MNVGKPHFSLFLLPFNIVFLCKLSFKPDFFLVSLLTPIMQARYLLLHLKGETEAGHIRRIVQSRHDVWPKERLAREGYPKPGNPFYYMLRIRKEDAKTKQYGIRCLT